MRRCIVQTQIERSGATSLDVIDRAVSQQIGQVAVALDGGEILVQVSLAQTILMKMVIGGAGKHSEEFIETVSVGPPLRTKTEMPLSDQRRLISAPFEE